MNRMHGLHNCRLVLLILFAIWLPPRDAVAYIDPGTTGMLSQVLYVLFYGILGVLFYFLKHIKSWVDRAKAFVAGLFGRNS